MDEISADYIQSCLNVLAEQTNEHVRYHLLKCNEKINNLHQWKSNEIDQLVSTNKRGTNAEKNIKVVPSVKFKNKVGRSSSMPCGGKVRGKQKLTFLNACSQQLQESPNCTSVLKRKGKIRRFKSLSEEFGNDPICSKTELMTVHADLTSKCNEFLNCASENIDNIDDTLKSKYSEELLEFCGVKKAFVERSLNKTRFPSLKLKNDIVGDLQDISSSTNDINNPIINEAFEILHVQNDEIKTSDLPDDNITIPNKGAVGKLKPAKQNFINGNNTPVGKHTLNAANCTFSTPTFSGQSNSGTPIIKKKNLISYLHVKSVMSSAKEVLDSAASNSGKSKKDCIKQPASSTIKTLSNARQLRKRTRAPPTEDKPIVKKTTKRTRIKDSPEEVKNKRKQKEENSKQQKLDLQLKKEEKKQQREERMRKTKEAREKLEQERREKLQSSEETKRANANKELEPKRKPRAKRQVSKLPTVKQTVPTLKVSRKTRKSGSTNPKAKKVKKLSLETVDENAAPSSDANNILNENGPKDTFLSNINSTFTLQKIAAKDNKNSAEDLRNANFTFTVKEIPEEENNNSSNNLGKKGSHNINSTFSLQKTSELQPIEENNELLPSNLTVDHTSKQETSYVPNTTYVTSKSPDDIPKQVTSVTPFKVPNITPKQNSKSSLRQSKRISSEVSYELTPYRDEDEDSLDDDESRKPIPNWASGIRLKEAVIKQACYPPNLDKLFGKITEKVDLEEIFGSQRRKIYKKRTSSAVWKNISFNLDI